MRACGFLDDALRAGVSVRVAGENLKVSGPPDVVASWAPILRNHRDEIIRLLAQPLPDLGDLLARAGCLADQSGEGSPTWRNLWNLIDQADRADQAGNEPEFNRVLSELAAVVEAGGRPRALII